ncbi:MAG TPA: FGGY-family carbohydrate kinase [bacterium]|nr:FGGY-family carbohydrate kinase [bacterium]
MSGPILALDAGTTACKGVLARDDGTPESLAVLPYAAGDPTRDPAVWWETLSRVVEQVCAAAAPPPGAVALCGRGGGLACLDDGGTPVPLPWSTILEGARARPIDAPAHQRLASWGAIYAEAQVRAPAAASRIARLCGVKDYLNYRLTGVWATDASSAGCREWPRDLAPFGLRAGMLPPIRPGTERLGPLSGGAGLPLPAGIPVCVGGHDGVCANLGAGRLDVGDGCITLATNGVVRVNTRIPVYPTPRFHTFTYPYLGEMWTSGGDVPAGGSAVGWAARLLGVHDGNPLTTEAALRRFDALAAGAPPAARGLLFLPYLRGALSPARDLDRRGAFLHLDLRHGREDAARAVLEGVAFALRHIRDALERSGQAIGQLCVTGGGSRSRVWTQIVASVLDQPLCFVEPEASARGAALLAAVGLGRFPTIAAAAEAMVRGAGTVDPDPTWTAVYRDAYARYLDAATS